MSTSRSVKRMLLGIELTILGGVLVLASSGSAGALGVIVSIVGLFVVVVGLADDSA